MRCLLSISLLAIAALGMPRERIKVNNSIILDASVAPKSQPEIQASAMPQQPSEIPDHQFSQIVRNAFKRPPPTNIDSILEEPSEFATASNAADQLDDSVQNIELAGIEFPLTEVQLLDLGDDLDLASEADVPLTGTAEQRHYIERILESTVIATGNVINIGELIDIDINIGTGTGANAGSYSVTNSHRIQHQLRRQ
ncbi:hypothetical protein LPJ66_004351 [Kickxella alabastrina]|uniref:Uncharacterized protein n=1 Tax=Kickxella alabastrina TaxID=61397 RepID=A0ACC1IHS4_9FUNG|nr:hypothetical protein LPJ66_004351 [Kickxella alabastrina]